MEEAWHALETENDRVVVEGWRSSWQQGTRTQQERSGMDVKTEVEEEDTYIPVAQIHSAVRGEEEEAEQGETKEVKSH